MAYIRRQWLISHIEAFAGIAAGATSMEQTMLNTPLAFLKLVLISVVVLTLTGSLALSAECARKPTTCMKVFVKAKDYESASNLYNENQELFLTTREKKRRAKQLQELSDNLNSSFAPQIDSLQESVGSMPFDALDPTGWLSVNSTLSAARSLLNDYDGHTVLKDNDYRLPTADTLAARLNSEQQKIDGELYSAFLAYDHSVEVGFFDVYPTESVDMKAREVNVRSAWPNIQPMIQSLSETELLHVIDAWTSGKPELFGSTFGADIRSSIADLYYDKVIASIRVQEIPKYEDFAKSVSAANAVSLLPSDKIKSRLLLVLLDAPGAIDVNFDLSNVSPFTVIRKLPDSAIVDSFDVMLLLGVTSKEFSERTVDTNTVRSRYQEGTKTSANPAYASAQSAYNSAVNTYNFAESNYARIAADYNACQAAHQICVVTAYNYGAAQRQLSTARNNITTAQNRLRNTKTSVTKPVYKDYEFAVSSIEIEKKIGAVVAMITSTGSATVAPFGLVASQELNVAVGINPKDAGSAKQYKTANDLKQEESKGVTLQVLDALANLGGSNASNQRVTNVSQFLATITEPKLPTQPVESLGVSQKALVVARSSHPAIGGVVVVHSPLGGVGSGFFIDEYTLLTNFHVVEDSDYVEIELFDGRSTTGQVFDFDIDRDLALVRISIKGQPLELFSGNTLPLGESVIAIGHPRGLYFTITKGIISAVREQKATTSLGLGTSFLFVQTDTAINPGNSGGPLLLDNKVIGINTQKLVDVQIEGIGFALHYTEIARYLAASMSN